MLMSSFNRETEIKLRILLLLESIDNQFISEEKILALDFIATFSGEFSLTDKNLHGDNEYKFSEITARRTAIRNMIKELVLQNLIQVEESKEGFSYKITNLGSQISKKIEGDYAKQYLYCIELVVAKYSNHSGNDLLALIEKKGMKNNGGDGL